MSPVLLSFYALFSLFQVRVVNLIYFPCMICLITSVFSDFLIDCCVTSVGLEEDSKSVYFCVVGGKSADFSLFCGPDWYFVKAYLAKLSGE